MAKKAMRPRRAKKSVPVKKLQGTMSEKALLRAFQSTRPFLGGVRASAIVLSCANTVAGDLERTVEQLDLECDYFSRRVRSEVQAAGYVPAAISCTANTRLIDVVTMIQNAPKA
jgi:hypothetical protein